MTAAQQTAAAMENDLAEKARSGDRAAFAALYEQYRPVLMRHARRMMGDDAAAADIVQESYARAIAAMPRTRSERLLFRAWIFRIATNLCLRELTRRSRYVPGELQPERLTGSSSGPEEHRRRTEISSLVEQALARLPDRYRQILILRELDELSYEDLCQVLEMNMAAVKVTLHRARARFAALFVAEQLLANPEAKAECPEIEPLVSAGERRPLERHLESCSHCRRAADRPAAELFALLPPLSPLPSPPPPPMLPGFTSSGATATGAAATTAAGTAAATATAGGPWVLGAALIATAVAGAVAIGTNVLSEETTRSEVNPAARPFSDGARAATPDSLSAQATTASSAAGRVQPRRSLGRVPPKKSPGRSGPGTASSAAAQPAPMTDAARPAASRAVEPRERPRRRSRDRKPTKTPGPVQQVVDPEEPGALAPSPSAPMESKAVGLSTLDLRVRLLPGTVQVARKTLRFALRSDTALHLGDQLITTGNHDVALLLPGHQWITVRGALVLRAIPLRAPPRTTSPAAAQPGRLPPGRSLGRSGPAVVELLAGELRGSANPRGRGLRIRVGQRVCDIDSGRFHLRVSSRDRELWISSADAYVRVSGPHARRVVLPGTGIALGAQVGFAHSLLPPPEDLRPVLHRGPTAPLLRWQPVSGARSYRVLIGDEADFLVAEEIAVVHGSTYRPRIRRPGKHFFRVVALARDACEGIPSKIYAFEITSNLLLSEFFACRKEFRLWLRPAGSAGELLAAVP